MRLLLTSLLLLSMVGSPVYAAKASSSSSDLSVWELAGFAEDDARYWSDAGFTVDEAVGWREFAGSYQHPRYSNLAEAQRWSSWGYTPAQADMFLNQLEGDASQAEAMATRGLSAHAAVNELREERGLSPLPEPFVLEDWRAAGFAEDDAHYWHDADFHVMAAADWRSFVNGYRHPATSNLREAQRWVSWGYTPMMANLFVHDLGGDAPLAEDLANRGMSAGAAIESLRYQAPPVTTPEPQPAPTPLPAPVATVDATPPVVADRPTAPSVAERPGQNRREGAGRPGTSSRARPGGRDGPPVELLRNLYRTGQQADGFSYMLNFCADQTVHIVRLRERAQGDDEIVFTGVGRWSMIDEGVRLSGPWVVELPWVRTAGPNRRLHDPQGDWVPNDGRGTEPAIWISPSASALAQGC